MSPEASLEVLQVERKITVFLNDNVGANSALSAFTSEK